MTELVTLRPGVTFDLPAAQSWARMEAERGAQLDTNSTYRDYDEQARARRAYLAYLAYQNGGPFAPWAPLALDPEESWHCLGLAADTDDDDWIRARPAHGWRFVVRTEKWHAQYYAGLDQYRWAGWPSSSSSTPFPINTPKEYPDMRLIKLTKDGATTYALIGTRFFQSTTDVGQANGWAESWGDAKEVSERAWGEALNAAAL